MAIIGKKKFRVKCVECDEEFQHEVEECPTCGGEVREPDPNDVVYGKWLLNQENSMEQSFLQVLYEIERDLNIVDDAFLILIKEYYVDEETGDIQFYRVKEVVRGDPIFMRIIADKRGVRGGRYRICRLHRDQVAYPGQDHACPICGSDMQMLIMLTWLARVKINILLKERFYTAFLNIIQVNCMVKVL